MRRSVRVRSRANAPGSSNHRDLEGVAGELHSRIDGHEDLCAERMRRIDERLQAGDAVRERMRCEMRDGFAALKQSLRDIHARLWWAAGGIIAGLFGVLVLLVQFLRVVPAS